MPETPTLVLCDNCGYPFDLWALTRRKTKQGYRDLCQSCEDKRGL